MRIFEPMRRTTLEIAYRLGGWPRRLAALTFLALAGVTALPGHDRAVASDPAPVVITARDLPAGTVLRAGDVRLSRWNPGQIPPRAVRSLAQAIGATIAAGMDRGEPITTARIRGPGITTGLTPGLVAVTVTITGPSTLALIRAGDRVDLLAATPADTNAVRPARVVATAVRVLAVLTPHSSTADDQSAGLVVAVSRASALSIASVVDGSMTATLRVPP
jgi:Flp pilus assembly protein CpaB